VNSVLCASHDLEVGTVVCRLFFSFTSLGVDGLDFSIGSRVTAFGVLGNEMR
jgi:hypothetical protein